MVPPAPVTFSTMIGLAERSAHALGHDARERVGRPARGERHDQGDGTRRIGLRWRAGDADQGGEPDRDR